MPYADTNGIRTYYEQDDGPPAATEEPLILLHGFTGSLTQWQIARPLLAAERRVVAYDLRGHGHSDAPDDLASYTITAYADDLRDLMATLSIPRAHILGSSFGGMVALEFALRYPERIDTLILADTSAGPRCIELSEPIAAREDGIERALAYAAEHGLSAHVERELAVNPALREDPHRRERFHERWRRMTLQGFLGAGKARNERPDHHEDLERLRMPVLIIAGDRDVLAPAAEYMHAHIRGSALRLINGAGHPAVADQPHGFVAVVRGFLAGRPVAGEPHPAG
jgi:pimeloyl-ACP methyl ester carboxylesterase